jgi:hypothetical protein
MILLVAVLCGGSVMWWQCYVVAVLCDDLELFIILQ